MVSVDLSRLMHSAEPNLAPHVHPLGLQDIRRRGRRRRTSQRIAAGIGAGAALAVVTAASLALTGGGVERGSSPAGPSHVVTGLTPYEHQVLRRVPGAYAVDGTVVVPGPVDESSDLHTRFAPSQIEGAVRPLGFDAYSQPGYLPSTVRYPRFMLGNPPRNAQVLADNGSVYLGCARWKGSSACTISVLLRSARTGSYSYVYGLGADDFLKPGAAMEVFVSADYRGHRFHPTVIGGFDGVDATRVELTLVDGNRTAATLDSGSISPGDTLFWARTRTAVASITAYGEDGTVVARHRVRSCSGGVDCEVR